MDQHQGFVRSLTLISAPAGYGKTTLLGEWISACERSEFDIRVAWLSLDEEDSDLPRFLAYLVAALQTVAANVGEEIAEALQSTQPLPTESALTSLVNEITEVRGQIVLILDDYHVIDAKAVDTALAFLIEHLPPQLHLIITTREDPQLPLARLRARGQLIELRVADLRFTFDEAAAFLNSAMGLRLSAEEVALLENRTEGWVAGLQLAAISLQRQEDAGDFIASFSGSHRFVLDYLVEEVLARQPESVQTFLLRTSILDRLCGPLCDAVLAEPTPSAQETLEYLEQANLFLVPLDNERRWYRYHPLFADLLRHQLQRGGIGRSDTLNGDAELHRRASRWNEEQGFEADAIRHALAGEDFERAAGLIELAWRAMDRSHSYHRWIGWARALPDELIRARPVLSVGFAWALLSIGDLEAAEARLRDGEQWLEMAAGAQPEELPAQMFVVDQAEFRLLPSTIATARAYLAQALGDVPGSIRHARNALNLLPEGDYLGRGVVGALMGLAVWTIGDLEEAYQTFANATANFERAGNLLYTITGAYILAGIRMAQGRLREAVRIYEHSIRLVQEHGQPPIRGTAELYLGLSELLREQGNEEAAAQHRQRSEELSEHAALPRWQYHWCLAQARIKQAEGDLGAALDLLDEAERWYTPGPVPDIRPISALKATIWIAQGRLAEAEAWANAQALSADDDFSYLREFEYITFARLLIGRHRRERTEGSIQAALALIERLLRAAEQGERTGSVLDLLILRALAHEAQGDLPGALAALEPALALAEPEGYVRVFVDEGWPMARLLSEAAARGMMPEYADRLLALSAGKGLLGADPPPPAFPRAQPLTEDLSARELEILQLVAEGLSNREIGGRLFIAVNTVKGHNRRMFDKLQVHRRTEAVARARELGLLA